MRGEESQEEEMEAYWASAAIMSRISPYTARIFLSFSLRFSSSSYTALNARIATS